MKDNKDKAAEGCANNNNKEVISRIRANHESATRTLNRLEEAATTGLRNHVAFSSLITLYFKYASRRLLACAIGLAVFIALVGGLGCAVTLHYLGFDILQITRTESFAGPKGLAAFKAMNDAAEGKKAVKQANQKGRSAKRKIEIGKIAVLESQNEWLWNSNNTLNALLDDDVARFATCFPKFLEIASENRVTRYVEIILSSNRTNLVGYLFVNHPALVTKYDNKKVRLDTKPSGTMPAPEASLFTSIGIIEDKLLGAIAPPAHAVRSD